MPILHGTRQSRKLCRAFLSPLQPSCNSEICSDHVNNRKICELVQGKIEYVRDLEAIEQVFIQPLREASPSIIAFSRLESFLSDVFHPSYRHILAAHQVFLAALQTRQLEQHPLIVEIADCFPAVIESRHAYVAYMTNSPVANAKVQEETLRNPVSHILY